MNIKRNRSKLSRYTVGIITLLLILVASFTGISIKHNRTQATPAVKQVVSTKAPSQFTFNGSANWRQGPTSMTDMALFHNIQESCFTSIKRKTGSIAAAKATHDTHSVDLVSNGYTVSPGATLAVTLQTNNGQKSYQLQQSTVTTPPTGEKILGGLEFGYLPLAKNDYIFVEGHCETYEQLAATMPALQAIEFDALKVAANN